MDNPKKNKIIISLLVVIIAILSVLCILFATGTISLKNVTTDNNKTNQNVTDNNINDNTSDNNQDEPKWTAYQQCSGLIYYNPVTNKGCNKEDNGCLGWYVISKEDKETDSQLELILNKNLGNTVAFNENNKPEEGPVTALNYLKQQTIDWKIEVRMPTISDVANILNIEKNEDGHIGVEKVPACLYSNGDSREYWDGGYWLADYNEHHPVFIIDCSRGLISAGNQFIKSEPTNSESWGVRPVIRIDKNVLQ